MNALLHLPNFQALEARGGPSSFWFATWRRMRSLNCSWLTSAKRNLPPILAPPRTCVRREFTSYWSKRRWERRVLSPGRSWREISPSGLPDKRGIARPHGEDRRGGGCSFLAGANLDLVGANPLLTCPTRASGKCSHSRRPPERGQLSGVCRKHLTSDWFCPASCFACPTEKTPKRRNSLSLRNSLFPRTTKTTCGQIPSLRRFCCWHRPTRNRGGNSGRGRCRKSVVYPSTSTPRMGSRAPILALRFFLMTPDRCRGYRREGAHAACFPEGPTCHPVRLLCSISANPPTALAGPWNR